MSNTICFTFHLPESYRKTHISKYTYLLTPWRTVLLEKLIGLQLVKKFPAFQGTRRFITTLTNVRHLSLSWASPIQSIYPHPISWRSILILSTYLSLGLPSGLFPSGFPTKTLYTPLSALRYDFFLFLKCLTSCLTLFRLSTLLQLGFCIHCILAHFL